MPLSLGSWLAGRRLTPHTLGTGQVPVRGPCTRGDGARGLRSLLCRSCRPPGSFPPVGGGGAEGELPVTQELSTSHTRFMRARAHTHTHTPSRQGAPHSPDREGGLFHSSQKGLGPNPVLNRAEAQSGSLARRQTRVFKTVGKMHAAHLPSELVSNTQFKCGHVVEQLPPPSVPRTLLSSQVDGHAVPVTHTHPAPGPSIYFLSLWIRLL